MHFFDNRNAKKKALHFLDSIVTGFFSPGLSTGYPQVIHNPQVFHISTGFSTMHRLSTGVCPQIAPTTDSYGKYYSLYIPFLCHRGNVVFASERQASRPGGRITPHSANRTDLGTIEGQLSDRATGNVHRTRLVPLVKAPAPWRYRKPPNKGAALSINSFYWQSRWARSFWPYCSSSQS